MTAADVSVRGPVLLSVRLLAAAHHIAMPLVLARARWPVRLTTEAAEAVHGAERDARAQTSATQAGGQGDECERFIERHQHAILNYLWRMTGDEQTAYDLTQEVFVRAWQRFDAVRSYDQPRAWLFRVATNLALTHLKRRASPIADAGPLDDALDDTLSAASNDPVWRLAESDHIRRTLLGLSPKRRAALVLREVYGLSGAEVARALGMSEPAVRMALHRAREQFREIYSQEGGTRNGS